MQITWSRVWSAHHLNNRGAVLCILLAVATLLELAAGTGLAYLAGFDAVKSTLGRFDWVWLIALAGALLISFAGYYYAYLGIFRADGGPTLDRRRMTAVVTAGFGGFLAHGGSKLDQYAIQAFEARAVDYLLKPIDEGRFHATLERVREQTGLTAHYARLFGADIVYLETRESRRSAHLV